MQKSRGHACMTCREFRLSVPENFGRQVSCTSVSSEPELAKEYCDARPNGDGWRCGLVWDASLPVLERALEQIQERIRNLLKRRRSSVDPYLGKKAFEIQSHSSKCCNRRKGDSSFSVSSWPVFRLLRSDRRLRGIFFSEL